LQTKGKKLAFCYEPTLGHFVGPIASYFSSENDVRLFELKQEKDLEAVLSWADLSWFDFCTMGTIFASRQPRDSKIVCRLHSFETFMPFPQQVDWDNVNALVFVADHIRSRVMPGLSTNGCKIRVIENGVDPSIFEFSVRKKLNTVGFVGPINGRKNLPMAMAIVGEINKRKQGDVDLIICGDVQDVFLPQYIERAKSVYGIKVTSLGHLHSMKSFYGSVDCILSTSLWESFQYALAEGMASGCVPLVHNWEGAESIWPKEYLFWTIAEAVDLFFENREVSEEKIKKNRDFVLDRFGVNRQMQETDSLLSEVLV